MEGMTRDQQEKMMTMQQWHMIQVRAVLPACAAHRCGLHVVL